jgi:tRNA threonylcarbamoyl adenosine modification protein (Sua5/YciO/YrdC/YwlC family)
MAEFIKIYEENPNPRAIKRVVEVLEKGGLVITNYKALDKIARIKGVKLEKANWSFICPDLSNLSDYVRQIETATFKILKRALPGPYTFILPSNNRLPKGFKKKKTVGIRIPDNAISQALVVALGNPIVSTSIYDEDELLEYTTDPELIFEKWQKLVDVVIDGGYGGNVASTVIDLSKDEPEVLREGKGDLDIL